MNRVYADRFFEATPMQRAHRDPVLIAGEGADALTETERTANARLIAAAPELLEALKIIAAWRFDFFGDCVADATNLAKAAIAKAEGK